MTEYQLMSPSSKIWIYQSNKTLEKAIVQKIKSEIAKFVTQWTAHNHALKAWGDFIEGRFIVLMVDESQAGASGCSIDKSVAFVKAIETAIAADFFDRFNFAYRKDDELLSASRDEFETLYKKGEINDNTLVFNNLVQTKAEFEEKWQLPLGQSWHKNFV